MQFPFYRILIAISELLYLIVRAIKHYILMGGMSKNLHTFEKQQYICVMYVYVYSAQAHVCKRIHKNFLKFIIVIATVREMMEPAKK